MIIIEGARNVGKTFLLDSLDDTYIKYKFSFGDYYRKFELNDKQKGIGFGIGKDLQIMKLHKEGFIPRELIMDRGFISCAIYSVLEGRCSIEWAEAYFKYVIDNFYDPDTMKILYVYGRNSSKRVRKDAWLNVSREDELELYEFFNSKIPTLKSYENEFNKHDKTMFSMEINTILAEVKERTIS